MTLAKQLKMKQNNKKEGTLVMLLGILCASWSGNLLTDGGIIRAGESILRAGQDL